MLAAAGLILLWSCEKDTEVITATPGATPTLTASATVLELAEEDADKLAVSFDWSAVAVQWSNQDVATPIIRYVLQLSLEEDNFQALLTSKDTEGTSVQFTHKELNTALIEKKKATGQPAAVKARLQVVIAPNRLEYTNIIDMRITPYDDYVMLPSLWLAGQFNGWSHSDDYRVGSLNSDNHYEGYNYFGSGTAFKFSSQANWDGTNYGDGGVGKLSTTGGDLNVPALGYYLLKADIGALTWSATKVTWGLIGAAVGSWDNDVAMTYDAEERVWKVTTNLVSGEWKFRANGQWDINFGPGDGPGFLSYGTESNLTIEEGGTYEVTLDLRDPGYYKYTLELQ